MVIDHITLKEVFRRGSCGGEHCSLLGKRDHNRMSIFEQVGSVLSRIHIFRILSRDQCLGKECHEGVSFTRAVHVQFQRGLLEDLSGILKRPVEDFLPRNALSTPSTPRSVRVHRSLSINSPVRKVVKSASNPTTPVRPNTSDTDTTPSTPGSRVSSSTSPPTRNRRNMDVAMSSPSKLAAIRRSLGAARTIAQPSYEDFPDIFTQRPVEGGFLSFLNTCNKVC